jgi:polar amino acid transport system substrate-binding protein
MRRVLVTVVALGLLASACGGSKSTTQPQSPGGSGLASCDKSSLDLLTPGKLTIGTDNPVFQPWFGGSKGAFSEGTPWRANPAHGTGNPYTGQGFEGSVAYALARVLDFTTFQEVQWVAVPFGNSFKPGPKDFDFYIGQISFNKERAQAVDFSDGYYDVQQALVANKGTPITNAKTFADLKDKQLGAQLATTSYKYIVDNIKPDKQPSVYDNSTDVIAALNAGQIDGYLVDAPTAYVNVLIGEAKHGVVVGQFPTIGQQEHFGLVLQKGSSLTACVNHAVAALHSNGTLDSLQKKWLKSVTFPEIKP